MLSFWIRMAAVWVFLLAAPGLVCAQEVTGRITDTTDAVLPGVTVTALHVDSGNKFVGISEGSGRYRIGALRPGAYNVTAELAGFATLTQQQIELLVGQQAVLNFRMTLSSLRESVTVTGTSPLIDVQQSSLGGNVDTRQMEALPVNGRDWMQLTALAPGSRRQEITGDSPLGTLPGSFQTIVDGQQITNTITYASIGQPKFSRDAIAEFELLSSRFDATQGRSAGVLVNAVTKAGTNRYAGTVSGYFRDDNFNAKDPVVNRVLPYSNQQISTTFGGPIKKDRVHFFGYYEGEREPQTIVFNSPFPRFNLVDLAAKRTRNMAGGRLDAQLSPDSRLMVRANGWVAREPPRGSGSNHPSSFFDQNAVSGQVFVSLAQTRGRSVNEIKGGLALFLIDWHNIVPGSPQINLSGYQIGGTAIYNPLREYQYTYSIRDDFSSLHGDHELKVGGEFLLPASFLFWPQARYGIITANAGPIPNNIEYLFPVWNDPSTWNLAGISTVTSRYQKGFGSGNIHCSTPRTENCYRKKPVFGGWFQDNWQVTPALRLNLGVRWDFALDGLANEVDIPPVRGSQPQEWLNFGPRLGFVYALPDTKTVIRGGWGRYYAGVSDTFAHTTLVNLVAVAPAIQNDGRPDFAANPFNGPEPTFEEAKRGRRDMLSIITVGKNPYSYQTSIGLQRQILQTLAVQADYVWVGARNTEDTRNMNVSFNPVSGANFPYRDISQRPFPEWGSLPVRFMQGYSNYHALETAFTKRFADRWQASATYTLSGDWSGRPLPINPGCKYPMNGLTMTCDTPFPVPIPPDLGGEYTLGAGGGFNAGDQRHKAVFNGIWDVGFGFQLSGLYSFGSGVLYATTYGADLRDSGGLSLRLRPDGTIVPRYNFVGQSLHRTDLRVQRSFSLPGGTRVEAMLEVFNLFNHANYGSYVTAEANRAYGRPAQNINIAYQPRIVQLGFRVAF